MCPSPTKTFEAQQLSLNFHYNFMFSHFSFAEFAAFKTKTPLERLNPTDERTQIIEFSKKVFCKLEGQLRPTLAGVKDLTVYPHWGEENNNPCVPGAPIVHECIKPLIFLRLPHLNVERTVEIPTGARLIVRIKDCPVAGTSPEFTALRLFQRVTLFESGAGICVIQLDLDSSAVPYTPPVIITLSTLAQIRDDREEHPVLAFASNSGEKKLDVYTLYYELISALGKALVDTDKAFFPSLRDMELPPEETERKNPHAQSIGQFVRGYDIAKLPLWLRQLAQHFRLSEDERNRNVWVEIRDNLVQPLHDNTTNKHSPNLCYFQEPFVTLILKTNDEIYESLLYADAGNIANEFSMSTDRERRLQLHRDIASILLLSRDAPDKLDSSFLSANTGAHECLMQNMSVNSQFFVQINTRLALGVLPAAIWKTRPDVSQRWTRTLLRSVNMLRIRWYSLVIADDRLDQVLQRVYGWYRAGMEQPAELRELERLMLDQKVELLGILEDPITYQTSSGSAVAIYNAGYKHLRVQESQTLVLAKMHDLDRLFSVVQNRARIEHISKLGSPQLKMAKLFQIVALVATVSALGLLWFDRHNANEKILPSYFLVGCAIAGALLFLLLWAVPRALPRDKKGTR